MWYLTRITVRMLRRMFRLAEISALSAHWTPSPALDRQHRNSTHAHRSIR